MLHLAQQTASEWIASFDWAFWVLASLLGLLAIALLYRALLRDRPKGKRRCGKCWYDMTGVPGLTCPECGRTHKDERRLHKRRRHKRIAALGLMTLLLSLAVAATPRVSQRGVLGSLPTIVIAATASVHDTPDARLLRELVLRAAGDRIHGRSKQLTSIAVARRLRTVNVTAYEARRATTGQSPIYGFSGGSASIDPAIQLALWLHDEDAPLFAPPTLLATGLDNPDPSARTQVLRGLASAKWLSTDIADAVAGELDAPDPELGRAAWGVVSAHPHWFTSHIEAVARASVAYDRSFRVLAGMGLPGANQLLNLIEHPSHGLDAIKWLSMSDTLPDDAGKRLAEYAARATDAERRNWSIFAACRASPNESIVVSTALVLARTDEDADVRHAALFSLSRSDQHRAAYVEVLTIALADPADNVRGFAAWQLGELGDIAEPALDALDRATDDPEPRVATAALKSARQIRMAVQQAEPAIETPPTPRP